MLAVDGAPEIAACPCVRRRAFEPTGCIFRTARDRNARARPEADRLAGTWLRQMRSACGTLCRLAASESMSQTGLLDGEGPWPVIAVPQPAWADAHMHDVVIMGALRAVRVLG